MRIIAKKNKSTLYEVQRQPKSTLMLPPNIDRKPENTRPSVITKYFSLEIMDYKNKFDDKAIETMAKKLDQMTDDLNKRGGIYSSLYKEIS